MAVLVALLWVAVGNLALRPPPLVLWGVAVLVAATIWLLTGRDRADRD